MFLKKSIIFVQMSVTLICTPVNAITATARDKTVHKPTEDVNELLLRLL